MERLKPTVKIQCPDCVQCQMCSSSRCRACRKGGHTRRSPELGTSFTHGAYLRWKRDRDRSRSGAVEFYQPKLNKKEI
ncbi:MAG: hypothetical protein JRL30_16870 [Deltaproteobacteria bacterium]|nr:hypothetical protein [Deltaproteobacteria bacterium]